ncbi:AI-2E family transporter [bacterium]|nr:AI-2E family transporter [bacterium]
MKQVVDERRAFLFLLVALGVGFFLLLKPVFMAVVLACIVAILLYPAYEFLLKKLKNRSYLTSFITTFLTFLILVLPFSLVVVQIISETVSFVSTLDLNSFFSTITNQNFYRDYIEPLSTKLETHLHITIDVPGLITRVGGEVARYVYNYSPEVLGRTLSFMFGFFVMHFTLFFVLIEGKNLIRILLDLSPISGKYEDRLLSESQNMIYATVYGYLLTALVQAGLAWIGFGIAGVKAPLVFATLTYFMSLVPIIGATSVWLPVGLTLLAMGDTKWGLFILIYGAVLISGVDNIIKPLIMRGKAKVHILLIFFSLFGGISLFGPIGILFGPVIMALFLASVRIYREDFVK